MRSSKKILYLYKTPRKNIYSDWKSGIGPDTALYGANHLEKLGYKVDIFDLGFSKLNPFRWLTYPFHFIFAKATGIGFNLSQALSLLFLLNKYDFIVSTMDSAGLPLLILKKFKLLKKPLIYISIDFVNRIEENKHKWPFPQIKKYLRFADCIICYSKAEQNLLRKINKKTYFLAPGTDINFFKSKKPFQYHKNKKPVVLAFGRDKDRDYKTFVDAIENIDCKGRIVTSKDNIKNIKIPKNVSVSFDVSPINLKKIIISSDIIVIPLNDVDRATGQLSLLDSLSCKKPVIVSKIDSILSTYNLRDNVDCIYVQPASSKDLTIKIKKLLNDRENYKKISYNAFKQVQNFSTQSFALNLSKIINTLPR